MSDTAAITTAARGVLKQNDRGGYTVPSANLYPFQWNWDSALVALGWATFDRARAWDEIDRLLEGQWPEGLVPHIIFHRPSDGYFPGPEQWGTRHTPPTSGITQPPVLASCVRLLLDRDPTQADRARRVYPKLLAWHRWWRRARDPEGSGLVAILHPWESGMDNSPAWDGPMRAVPQAPAGSYVRRDTKWVAADERPRAEDYDRYIYLLQLYRAASWDPVEMWRSTPFKVADLCNNALLLRADEDLLALAARFGTAAERSEIEAWRTRGQAAFAGLWNDSVGLFQPRDLLTGKRIEVETSAAFLSLWAGLADGLQAQRLAASLERWGREAGTFVPSVPKHGPGFDAPRYWRGPVWAIVNWMIARGLDRYDLADLAARVDADTERLIARNGFREYFDPLTGAGAGGPDFTWTAAIWLLLRESR